MKILWTVCLLIVGLNSDISISQVSPNQSEMTSACPVIRWIDYPRELDYEAPVFEVRVEGGHVNAKLKIHLGCLSR